MATYISLLHGINVSGKNKIRMPDLVNALEKDGFGDVKTYIQSGNILFSYSKMSTALISRRVETAIMHNLGLPVPAQVLTHKELSEIIASNPFISQPGTDPAKLHVTFLADDPSATLVEKLQAYKYHPDEIIVSGRVIYLHLPNGYGRTKFTNTFIESKLEVSATTRNWRTCLALEEMCIG